MNAPMSADQMRALLLDTPLSHDPDPAETAEWRDAFLALAQTHGPQRARQMLMELARLARQQRIGWQPELATPYVNTIAVEDQPPFPGDLAVEERLASLMRWNALAMVAKANQAYGELGGHIASYASAADLFETGFNHFFHARKDGGEGAHRGDLVFFQPHSAPGVYARAFLEGRLSEEDLKHYRQELTAPAFVEGSGARGLSSYPHPWLMPDFWQFPTGSMGIGPISSIYHARFMRYLSTAACSTAKAAGLGRVRRRRDGRARIDERAHARGAREARQPRVGGQLQPAAPGRPGARQRPHHRRARKAVRRRGLERHQAVWGSDWDGLFARDVSRGPARVFAEHRRRPDADLRRQRRPLQPRQLLRPEPRARRLAEGMTDEQIDRLKRGGHDM
jgi:pyruvate dehydrogenase E1 component